MSFAEKEISMYRSEEEIDKTQDPLNSMNFDSNCLFHLLTMSYACQQHPCPAKYFSSAGNIVKESIPQARKCRLLLAHNLQPSCARL